MEFMSVALMFPCGAVPFFLLLLFGAERSSGTGIVNDSGVISLPDSTLPSIAILFVRPLFFGAVLDWGAEFASTAFFLRRRLLHVVYIGVDGSETNTRCRGFGNINGVRTFTFPEWSWGPNWQ